MAATNVIHHNVYVTPDIDKKMKSGARRDGITIARWVRDAIRLKLEREAERAQAQG